MPGIDLYQVAIGALLALIVTCLAYAVRALSRSGAIAAVCLGTVIFGLGGLAWAALLLAFFIPSSVLSLIFKKRKAPEESNYEKGSRRDAWQVLANGGLVGVAAIAHSIIPGSVLPWWIASAALAAASADTWATELGVLSRKDPVLITSRKRVAKGTSGGISIEGEVAALIGALLVAGVSMLLAFAGDGSQSAVPVIKFSAFVILSGLIGCHVDSLLGATSQAIYYCPTCGKETEKHPLHTCSTRTLYRRGIRWLGNDLVNLACTASAVLTVVLMGLAI